MTLGMLLIFFSSNKFLVNSSIFILMIYSLFLIVTQFTVLNKGCSCISFIGLDLIPNLILNFILALCLVINGSKDQFKFKGSGQES